MAHYRKIWQLEVVQLLIDSLPRLEAVIVHGKEARVEASILRRSVLDRGALFCEFAHLYNAPFRKPGSKLAGLVAEIECRRGK